MKPLVIFHKDCFDGVTAAWVYRHFYGDTAEFFGARYGDPAPIEKAAARMIYIIDFSYPRDWMKLLMNASLQTIVLDHHKTAEAALDGLAKELLVETGREHEIVFDMNRSGAGIAWDYFAGIASQDAREWMRDIARPRPWLVNYVEDRDLWLQSLPDCEAVSAWIATVPMTMEAWDELYATPLKMVVERGQSVQKYIELYGVKARKEMRVERIRHEDNDPVGWLVPCVNMPYMNCSEHVGRLAEEHPEAPFAAGYFRRGDGRWQFSLRSRGGFDVSNVAKLFGGGGHKGAAGFDVKNLREVFA